jgi:hypothetical protein
MALLREAHLGKNHGRDLLGGESLGRSEILDLDDRVAGALFDDLEGPRLDILLDNGVAEWAANQTPAVSSY